jgi:HIRAN domain
VNRIDFIKNIMGTGIISWLGINAKVSRPNPLDKKVIYDAFVRGLTHSPGIHLLDKMKSNDPLTLVREPDNIYDEYAIALYYNSHKIGYVPAEDNHLISQLIDADHVSFTAEIVCINLSAPTWEQVAFRILSSKS